MSLILIILFLVLFVIIIVPTIILSLISTVLSWFGIGPKRRFTYTRTYGGARRGSAGNSDKTTADDVKWQNNRSPKRKKFFDKNDGEYVDFEEIKD